MKFSFKKIPLYLGLFFFAFSIIASSFRLSEERRIANIYSQAQHESSTNLSLGYFPPNIVSVYVSSNKAVSGIDAVINYDGDKVDIDIDNLHVYPSFKVLRKALYRDKGRIAISLFSETPIEESSFMAFSFQVKPKLSSVDISDDVLGLSFFESGVYQEGSAENILDRVFGF